MLAPPPSARKPVRALLVEDSEDDAFLLVEALRHGGYQVDWKRVDTEAALHRTIRENNWDLVLCDYTMPSFDAPRAIRALREEGYDLPTIVVSGTVDETIAAETLRLGANDYLLKDNLTRLPAVVERELREADVRRERKVAEQKKFVAEEALRQSETRLRQAYMLQKSLFNALPAHVALVDSEGVILEVNSAWGQFAVANAGQSANFGIGQNYLEVCARSTGPDCEEARKVGEGLRRVLRGEVPHFSLEYPCHAPELQRWFRVAISPVQSAGARHAVVMHVDISARKSAEEELMRIKTAVEYASDAIAIVDLQGRGLYHNRTFVELLGYTSEDLNSRGGASALFIHSEVAGAAFQAIESEGSWSGNAYLVGRTGQAIELFLRMNAVLNDDGQAIATIIVCTDLRELRRTQRKIEEQAALLDQAQDAIMVRDLTGRIGFWNKGAERIFGWTSKEALGRRVQDLLYETGELFDTAMTTVLRQGVWSGEMSKLTRDGLDVLVETRWTLLHDDFGDPKSILTISTDITEKKKLEAQFLRAQRVESIGTLAGGIAHDLNNVLGPIIMAVDLFKLKLNDPRDLEILETVELSAQRGAELVKQVLSFTRGLDGRRTPLSARTLLSEIQKITRETFPKSVNIQVTAPDHIWTVAGDATQLHQVLLNLCVNARDAMPGGGRLVLAAHNLRIDSQFTSMRFDARPGSYVVLEVSDTGTGMSREIVERIFEPFFTTKAAGQGTGLGLSTSLTIVRNHGGFLTVESELGQGTTVKVHLPADTEGVGVKLGDPLGELPRGRGECVLIIDDEASVRSITGQTLEAYGYKVLSAVDGADGVAKFAQHAAEINVVLTDMMMPVLDGVPTIRALMRMKPNLPILAASGMSGKGLEAEAMGLGVRRFLPKPYTAESLLRTLREVLHPVE